MLVCPVCSQLVFSRQLKCLASEAEEHERAHRISDALSLWREALDLLPPQSRQHATVQEKIATLASHVTSDFSGRGRAIHSVKGDGTQKKKWRRGLGWIGVLAVVLWKFKFLVVFVLTKAKFLLLGLTKGGTLFSMLLSFGLYWTAWGWKFAAGLIASIYIHEMGHVFWLQRYGIKATAPMFIPGFGAMIRLKQYPTNPAEEARVGLAGPLWGLGAAVLAGGFFLATGAPYWAAIARLGGWINLFNLLPVWQLDGAHAFKALTRFQRLIIVLSFGGMFLVTGEGLLILLAIVGIFRLFDKQMPTNPDMGVFLLFLGLIVFLSFLVRMPVLL